MVNALKTREIGDVQPDGTIYAGISPTTGLHMYAAPADSPSRMAFNQAASYARRLQVDDKNDFRVPDPAEMKLLAEEKLTGAFNGTFKARDEDSYWTSQACGGLYAEEVRLRDGYKDAAFNQEEHFVRCIRYGL